MRRPNDFYPTPTWATEHMIDAVPFSLAKGIILEPCCGARDIVRPIQQHNPAVFTCDIDRQHQPDLVADMTRRDSWDAAVDIIGTLPQWVITNPPFNAAHHILPLALECCTVGVIALLRISYSEPCENRARWLWENQERQSILYLPRRVSFTGDGNTDNVATAWFIWGKTERLAPPFIYPRVDVQQMALML
jgi:hypothetical protein